mmetsp:Transcript_39604/g.73387  ORF Transcript_39604/g.73387 Transcript_39604/m.73387 type:complete len:590 (+) Transcript_39604:74-1843(+)
MGVMEESNGHSNGKRQKVHHDRLIKVMMKDQVSEHVSGTTAKDVLNGSSAVAARVDNVVVPLSVPIEGSAVRVEPIPLASIDGIRVLVETLKFLLKIAKQECAPELAITIGRPIGSAYICQLTDRKTGAVHAPTEELLSKFKTHMQSLIKSAIPMQYMTVEMQEAVSNMSRTGTGFTSKMLADCNQPQVQVVECRGFYHLPRASVMPCTDMVPTGSFNLTGFKDCFFLEHLRCDPKTGEAKLWPRFHLGSEMVYNEYLDRQQWARNVNLYTVAQLNCAIREGRSKQVIQAVEANCDRQFVELAAQVRARSGVKLILIAGPSASGKTTFAKRLQVQLESLGFQPEVLSVDNFYKSWQDITSEGPHKVDWESLDSLNLNQLNEVLPKLLVGEEQLIPEYDMKTSMPMDRAHWKKMQLKSEDKGVIIMEGIHCLNPALTAAVPKEKKFNIAIAPIPAMQLDAVHVLSGTTIRMMRRMVRDYLNRGRPVITTLKQWPSVMAGEVHNIYPNQVHADAVMNSEISYEMSVLKVHVEPLLKTVKPAEREYSEARRLLETLDQFIALPTNIIPPQSLLREFIGGSWYYDYGGWYKGY